MKENSAYTIFNQENMETVKTRKAGKKIERDHSMFVSQLKGEYYL